jgi:hypothetical protein
LEGIRIFRILLFLFSRGLAKIAAIIYIYIYMCVWRTIRFTFGILRLSFGIKRRTNLYFYILTRVDIGYKVCSMYTATGSFNVHYNGLEPVDEESGEQIDLSHE